MFRFSHGEARTGSVLLTAASAAVVSPRHSLGQCKLPASRGVPLQEGLIVPEEARDGSQRWHLRQVVLGRKLYGAERTRCAQTCTGGCGGWWGLNLESQMWALGWSSSCALLRNLAEFYPSRLSRGSSQSFRAGMGKGTCQGITFPDNQWHYGGNPDESVYLGRGGSVPESALLHHLQISNPSVHFESTYLQRTGGVRKQQIPVRTVLPNLHICTFAWCHTRPSESISRSVWESLCLGKHVCNI